VTPGGVACVCYLLGIIGFLVVKVKGERGFSCSLPGGWSLSLFISIHYNSLRYITIHYFPFSQVSVSPYGGGPGVLHRWANSGRASVVVAYLKPT